MIFESYYSMIMNNMRIKTYEYIKRIADRFGYELQINRKIKQNRQQICLNIGAGNWRCDSWINLDYSSEWYRASQKHPFLPYDIRNDTIPFDEDVVDAIYCSHVIEHIENEYVQNMFSECYRVLKKGGVLRIAVPDADFIYTISKINSEYWWWRDSWFTSGILKSDYKPRNVDYCVRELATPKLLAYKLGLNEIDYINDFDSLDKCDFFEKITNGLEFRDNTVGDHINYWTYTKLEKMLQMTGFTTIIQSKYGGSCCKEMTDLSKFDLTNPQLSLYVETIK